MKRRRALTFTVAAVVGLTTVLLSAPAAFGATSGAGKLGLDDPLCASQFSLCADSVGTLNGYYVGHDEPRSFKSNKPKKCVPDSDKNDLEGRTRRPRTTSASTRATRSWSFSSTGPAT